MAQTDPTPTTTHREYTIVFREDDGVWVCSALGLSSTSLKALRTKINNTNERPMSLDEAAKALGCSRRWLQGWIAAHPGHGYRIGRLWRFLPADIVTMREAMKCRSSSSDRGKTKMVLGMSAGLSGDDALRKALALASAKGRKNSGRVARQNSSTRPSTVVPLSRPSPMPLPATSNSEAKADS